jgi:ATP synthase protein I
MNDDRERWRQWRPALLLSSAGLTLAAAAAFGFLGGFYVDRWLGTSPWFVLVLGTLGIVAGFRELIRAVNRVTEEEDERSRRQSSGSSGKDTRERDDGDPGSAA